MTLNTQNLKDWGCVMWLPLDGDANDYIGNYNGTRNGVTERRLQNGASCYNFDGNDDIIVPYKTNGGNYSISIWVYPTSYKSPLDTNPAVCGETSFGEYSVYGFLLIFNGKFTMYYIKNTTTQYTVSTLESYGLNKWYNICCTRNSNDNIQKIYVNGEFSNSAPCGGLSTATSFRNLKLGGDYDVGWGPYMRYFYGRLANLMIFNDHVLTDEQVKALYKATYIGD